MPSNKHSISLGNAPKQASFLKSIQQVAHDFSLWKRGDRIVVAVSGGPDSMCLLECLVALGKKYDWALHIAHVNYALRGEDSDRDEQLVRERAHDYGVPVTVLRPDVSSDMSNLEARLRAIRYEFFEALRIRLGFDTIAVAHTEDDQSETVLLRLLRGSGLRGLGAMRPRDGVIIRPLLCTPKEDIVRYLEENALPFRIDRSNADLKFTRNRIRHELLPVLEAFNPRIRATLTQSALSLADDADVLAEGLKHATLFVENSEKTQFSLNASAFCVLHTAVQRAMLRNFVEEAGVFELPPSFSVIEEMRKFIASTKNKVSEKSFRGLKFTRRGDRVSVLLENN